MSEIQARDRIQSFDNRQPGAINESPVSNPKAPDKRRGGEDVDVIRKWDPAAPGPKNNNRPQPPGASAIVNDPSVLIPLVMVILNQLEEKQIKSFSKDLESAQPRYEKTMDVMIAKIEEQAKKQAEIQKKQKENQIISDVQLGIGAAMTVFGILATILTAGALSPLIGVGMAIGASMTALDIVNRGLKAGNIEYDDPLDKTGRKKNPLDISIGGLVKMAVEKHASTDDKFFPIEIIKKGPAAMEKYRNEVIMGVSIFISLAIAGSTIALSVGGIVGLKNAAKTAKDGVDLAKDAAESISTLAKFGQQNGATIQMVNQVTEVGSDIANLGLSTYQNISGLSLADTKFSAMLAGANATRLQAAMSIINEYINTIKSTTNNTSKSINESKQILIQTQTNIMSSDANKISSM
jgi:hypothetical protein